MSGTRENAFAAWMNAANKLWAVKRLKYAVTLVTEKVDASASDLGYIGLEHVEPWTGRLIAGTDGAGDADGLSTLFRRSDVLFGKLRPYLAKVHLADHEGICSGELLVLRPRLLDARYLRYFLLMSELIAAVNASTYGSKMPRANWEFIGNLPVSIPAMPEQRAIADFLDCETARFDELVQRKRSLLTKLEEERVAVVASAVTKGLPAHAASAAGFTPNPRLKQTGVDWLGEVPDHWKISQLKWVVHFQRGHDLPSESRQQGQVPVVSSAGLIDRHSMAAAKGPGIVTGRYGSIGEFYLIEQDYWPLNTTLYSTSLRGNDPRFVVRMLANLAPLFLLNAVKSAVPGVDRNDIHPVLTAVPPLSEQTAIAAYVDREEARIKGVVAKVEAAIRVLNDYRSAIISAAVTGQIDVRNYRPQEAAALCQ